VSELSTSNDEEVSVSIRFVVEPFEVSIRARTKRSGLSEFITDIFDYIKQNQNNLADAVSGIDLKKIKPIEKPVRAPVEDPVEKVSVKIGVDSERLKQILRVEDGTPIIIAHEKFRSPEKGAMVLIYAYQFGLGKKPSHKEIGNSFRKSGFRPAFGKRTKGSLKQAGKIDEEDDVISLTGSGISDAEEEVKRIVGSSA